MSYSILEFFDSLEDKRRSQGMRHKFGDLMIIVIMVMYMYTFDADCSEFTSCTSMYMYYMYIDVHV